MVTLAHLAKGLLEDGDGKKNETVGSSCAALSEGVCNEAGVLFVKTVKDCLKKFNETVVESTRIDSV